MSAAIANRRRLPDAVRSIQLPVGSARAPVRYLVDVIYSRDMWMHRMEIALVTGRAIVRAADHEGRLTALVMLDLSRRLTSALENSTVVYRLTGKDGGTFRFGPSTAPAAALTIDAVDFHLLASGRLTAADARSLATVDGDQELGERVLRQTVVIY